MKISVSKLLLVGLSHAFVLTSNINAEPISEHHSSMVRDVGNQGDHHDHEVQLKTGRYIGTLEMAESKKRINTIIDLFYFQEGFDYPKLKATVKLVLGNFASHEYLNSTYEEVFFDPKTKTLIFDSSDQELILNSVMIHGKMLMGQFRSKSSGASGTFTVEFSRSFDLNPIESEPELPEEPCLPGEPCDDEDEFTVGTNFLQMTSTESDMQLIRELLGEYTGECKGKKQKLQLVTRRTSATFDKSKSPFDQYQIIGNLGELKERGRNSNFEKIISFNNGSYDFYSGSIHLFGTPSNLRCNVIQDRLTCENGCGFTKTFASVNPFFSENSGGPLFYPRGFKIDRGKYQQLAKSPEASTVAGTYTGFLHNEQLDLYQEMSFHIEAYNQTNKMHGTNTLYLVASAKLGFSNNDSDQFIGYSFTTRPWLYSDEGMAFEGDDETFAVVRDWRMGFILLDWYSKNFGRVGTVELVRNQNLELPSTYKKTQTPSGTYSSNEYSLELDTGAFGGAEREPYNPLYPLRVTGQTRTKNTDYRSDINIGEYDFYTGAIYIENDYGSFLFGKLNQEKLQLFLGGANSYGIKMQQWKFENYLKTTD